MVQDWRDYGGTIVTTPVLTSDVEDVAPYGPTGWRGRPIVMTDELVFCSYGAGLKNANGFWEQIAGDGVEATAQWQLIGSNSIIKDEHAITNPSYHSWSVYGTYPAGDYGMLYYTQGLPIEEQPIIHPGLRKDWGSTSSNWNPPPTFVYSESGGYFPAETVVSGLTYTGKAPEIGGFYNADATIKAEKFFPA